MFTGIVQGVCNVVSSETGAGITRIAVDLGGLVAGLELGASIAVNGACVTTTEIDGSLVGFDLIKETVELSNLGELAPGTTVNVERSFRVGDEVGGHILSGHIAGVAVVSDIASDGGHRLVTVVVPREWMAYLLLKGFVALNGVSLTIAEVDRSAAAIVVSLIPETLARTTFNRLEVGDRINLEVDSQTQAIVDTVRAALQDESLLEAIR
ncbi:MAG: riboflavin synthase subunit alpha [Pseudomonadota bacterium]|nr:riboflavin synthase [Gammaproteobacteria bacterium]MBG72540.1 riboflavin synthase [Gammaproteobacteria bacterium]MEC9285158.1 riboflavin synthase subunit alpha [Pseudomonadota bacterium]HBP16132.1 riboflavin synthase [Gammaproteobacteria bacterium]HCP49497.1 riboflavin synthase [Gammaproteobacteria bacterium]